MQALRDNGRTNCNMLKSGIGSAREAQPARTARIHGPFVDRDGRPTFHWGRNGGARSAFSIKLKKQRKWSLGRSSSQPRGRFACRCGLTVGQPQSETKCRAKIGTVVWALDCDGPRLAAVAIHHRGRYLRGANPGLEPTSRSSRIYIYNESDGRFERLRRRMAPRKAGRSSGSVKVPMARILCHPGKIRGRRRDF